MIHLFTPRKFLDYLKITNARCYKKSYSQCGEDIIIDFILSSLRIPKPTYLDIGANDPIFINNTYFFYKKGCSGVLIEPNKIFCEKISNKRPRDICLNIGIGSEGNKIADFYVMSSDTLSTFSKEEAERYSSYGSQKIKEVQQISLLSANEIMEKYFSPVPNLISLDIEGWDLNVLQSIDFKRFRPQVFCVETLTYTENSTEQKIKSIIDFLDTKDYFVYADTYINTIFVDRRKWEER